MPKLIIDGKEYEASEGSNCLEAALENDLDLAYFCYHPALGSVGSCRLCAVKAYKDENDKQGRIVMACMEPVTDGKRISIKDEEVTTFRRWVTEWQMINHPHDCPVCDEGGECHLQDMTAMTGHRTRRYRGAKLTHNNQHLGPLINHEMNRCIQCYRCVRYYQDYSGGHDLIVLKQHGNVYFGRREDGVLQSPFAGNLIDVCPTGVYTDKTLKDHFIRKWNLESAPSVCTHCSVGCNILPGASYGKLRRILPRYNEEVNGYFLCDRGRFGHAYTNANARLRDPLIQHNGTDRITDRKEAWQELKVFCQGNKKIAGIGSPRASLEANFALKRLVGAENFSNGMSPEDHELTQAGLEIYQNGSVATPTIKEVEQADAIFILGADVTNEIPRHDLAIRQAVKNRASLYIASSRGTPLDEIATSRQSCSPNELLQSSSRFQEQIEALSRAERPLIIVGWYHGLPELIRMAGSLAQKLQKGSARFLVAFPEANSVGVGLMGGYPVSEILKRIEDGEVERVILLENNLLNRTSNSQQVQEAHTKLERLMLLDHSESISTALATDVIPVATMLESNGTWVNAEGRAARAYQVYIPHPWVPQSWEVLRDLPDHEGQTRHDDWKTPEDVLKELADTHPIFQETLNITPPAGYRQQGQKIPRLSQRASGRMAHPAIKDVQQHLKPPDDPETPFTFSMEGSSEPPWSLAPRYWSPNWNSSEAIGKYQAKLGLGLHGGSTGKRLIEPNAGRGASVCAPVPKGQTHRSAPTQTKKGQILLVPAAEIFGSEHLSRKAEALKELTPKPYLELHPDTASQLQLEDAQLQTVSWSDYSVELVVRINDSVPPGTGVVPARFPETRTLQAPCAATIGGKSR